MKLNELTAHEVCELVAKREVTAAEVTEDCLKRIEEIEAGIRGFIRVDQEEARSMAAAVDRSLKKGDPAGPLAGLPVALKDIFCVRGKEITAGSKILRGFIAPYDATVVKKLRQAGSVFLGQTNMDEFAMGSSTENSGFGPTRNPWDRTRVPGGSSGGAAAVLAADEALLSLGSDTGGSIRQPASLCGVAGLKPTYGRVSRYGLIAYASSLDQIGPLGKDVEDIALLLEVLAGHDSLDSTSASLTVPAYRDCLIDDVGRMTLGVPRESYAEGMEDEVKEAFQAALKTFRDLGARVVEIELPRIPYTLACYYILSTAEASSNLARFDGVQYGYRVSRAKDLLEMYERTRREGFGEEVKRRIILGTYVLSAGYYEAYYAEALKVRRLIKNDYDAAFKRCDCVIMPTSPGVAFKIGEKTADPLQMYLSDIFTISVNLAGLPAISVNCGFSRAGLPIGLQVIAPPFAEEKILQTAYTFEQNTEFHKLKPALTG
jgi:aspartyl-tRNA(Asn)/glutamyl-tRNA(Gln) amidotransferase subunit A